MAGSSGKQAAAAEAAVVPEQQTSPAAAAASSSSSSVVPDVAVPNDISGASPPGVRLPGAGTSPPVAPLNKPAMPGPPERRGLERQYSVRSTEVHNTLEQIELEVVAMDTQLRYVLHSECVAASL